MSNPVGRPPIMRAPGKYIISNGEYHADPYYFSSSQFKEALISPYHFKNHVLTKDKVQKSKKEFDLGSVIHTVVLEPFKFDDEYAIYPGKLTPNGHIPVKAVRNHEKEFPNHTLITPSDYELAKRARKNFENYPEVAKLLYNPKCEYEPSYFHHCNETGLNLRVRPDCINLEDGYIIDLKSTRTTSKHEFKRDALYKFNYDLSAYMYLKVIFDMFGVKCDYYWATAGTESLCPTAMYKLSDATIEGGKDKFYKSVDNVKEALVLPDDCRFQNEIEVM